MPALPGVDHDGVHVRTRADARARLGPDRHVLIVGGGWIGLEVAATARQSGSKVTVLEREARRAACSRRVGASGDAHAANGVALRLNAGLRAVGGSADGRPVAELADGSSIVADAIVLGVGLTPNDAGARRRHCLRSRRAGGRALPHIGAGRTRPAMWRVRAAGGGARLESWQNAQDQGTAAALSALGLGEAYRPTGAVWSEQYDAMVQIVGFPALAASEVLRPQADARALLSVALDAEGRAVAGVTVNAARELRQLRKWIAQGAVLDPALLRRSDAASAQIG